MAHVLRGPGAVAQTGGPSLTFTVVRGGAMAFAAVPTLRFALSIASAGQDDVRGILLSARIRIAVARRAHDRQTRERLREVFGDASQWPRSAQSLHWTTVTSMVPAFRGETTVELAVPCTYDFEVTTAKYFHAIRQGDIPLQFLFGGSVFYVKADGMLGTERIPWDREASFRLPVTVWTRMMDQYFPGSGWLRLRRDTFDRLQAWKARHAFPTWERAVDALLSRGTEAEPPNSS